MTSSHWQPVSMVQGVVIGLILLSGCTNVEPFAPTCSESRTLGLAQDSGAGSFRFVACARSEQNADESVHLFVGIRNVGSPEVVRASFDLYGSLHLEIRDEDGPELPRQSTWHPFDVAPGFFQLARDLLPPGGVTGRVIDLTCDGPEGPRDGCVPLYEFQPDQTYSLTVRLQWAYWCPSYCKPDETGEVDERRIEFAPVQLEINVN